MLPEIRPGLRTVMCLFEPSQMGAKRLSTCTISIGSCPELKASSVFPTQPNSSSGWDSRVMLGTNTKCASNPSMFSRCRV